MQSAVGGDGGALQVGGEALGVQGRRHHHQRQVGAAVLLQTAQEPQGRVGFEVALVEFVEHHDVKGRQAGIGLQQAQEEALGEEANRCGGGQRAVVAGLVADELAECGAHFRGDAAGNQAGGEAPGLQHGDARAEGAVEDLGNLGGFARAGWRGEHQAIARCQMGQDFLLVREYRQQGLAVLLERVPEFRGVGEAFFVAFACGGA